MSSFSFDNRGETINCMIQGFDQLNIALVRGLMEKKISRYFLNRDNQVEMRVIKIIRVSAAQKRMRNSKRS
jgi:hypothetical protein